MARKFQLPSVPETTPKNIRFPNEIIQQVDEAIQGTNVTFSRFVIEPPGWRWRVCGRRTAKMRADWETAFENCPPYGEGKGAYTQEDFKCMMEMERNMEALLHWLESEGSFSWINI